MTDARHVPGAAVGDPAGEPSLEVVFVGMAPSELLVSFVRRWWVRGSTSRHAPTACRLVVRRQDCTEYAVRLELRCGLATVTAFGRGPDAYEATAAAFSVVS